jgi:hypothetical protein
MIILFILLGLIGFWIFYLAAMSLLRASAEKKLSLASKWLGYPVIAIGALIDLAFNAILFSMIFLELPQEWMLTKRLKRHIKHGTGWRKSLAQWICRNLLNPFDHTGNHCD